MRYLHIASTPSHNTFLPTYPFTYHSQAPEKKDAKGQRVPPPPPGGPKGAKGPTGIAKQMSNMRKSASNLLRGDFTVHDRQKSFKLVSPSGGSIGASNMLADPQGKGKKKKTGRITNRNKMKHTEKESGKVQIKRQGRSGEQRKNISLISKA